MDERKWGRFPALRRILESKGLPASLCEQMSVSENVFDRIRRTLEIALSAFEAEPDIAKAAFATGPNEMLDDLERVRRELDAAMSFIEDASRKVRHIEETIHRAWRAPDSRHPS